METHYTLYKDGDNMTNPTESLIDKAQERPSVVIHAQTANTIGVSVTTKNGSAWLIIGHDGIIVTPKDLEVEVRP